MTAAKFRFDLFDPDIRPALINCRYINLPFDLPVICKEINVLLTDCALTFFEDNSNSESLTKCAHNAKIILDICWEKINTGHWKDVDKNWRYAYSLGSLFKVLSLMLDKKVNKSDVIKACDMGLLMGAPVMQNILSCIASKLSAIASSRSNLDKSCTSEVKRQKIEHITENVELKFKVSERKNVSCDEFYSNYIDKNLPVVLLDAIADWPAMSSSPWSVESILEKTKYRTVPIEIGSKYTDDSWTQKLMTMEQFVNTVYKIKLCTKKLDILLQHNIFDQIPELLKDIRIPMYISKEANEKNVDISIYFGPKGTVSPLHHDPKRNLLAQVIGEKYLRLFPEEATEHLYPRINTWLSNTSQIDVDNPDLETFPLYAKAVYEECILKPGQVLYIPPGHWHYVRSLSVSLSISFWW
ncbi:lysine-specific demethylase 8-like [Uloborus diversus]|uniref:lysine-specific demethylase 8-like n=1 Tax=Uloborus diversus TaxID=327109 RepID=UPI00240943E0|nr:lysine-specific demethylase 8-like [Uloborus diversus]